MLTANGHVDVPEELPKQQSLLPVTGTLNVKEIVHRLSHFINAPKCFGRELEHIATLLAEMVWLLCLFCHGFGERFTFDGQTDETSLEFVNAGVIDIILQGILTFPECAAVLVHGMAVLAE